ncbi:MAG: tetratricopeptide repeat protein, partial [Planctomycetales bacterium]|nr:tetratricopeptide repeat protein [Planctomycetales bacterium]
MDRYPLRALALLICLLAGAPALAVEPPAKAARYHSLLLKRPGAGYLFDRFYNAWLDEQPTDSLEAFLREQSEEGSAASHLLLAVFYAKQGAEVRALAEFKTALEIDPTNASAWLEKAALEARALNLEAALKDLQQAEQASPSDELRVRISKLRGQLLIRAGRRDEALQALRSLSEQNPQDQELAEDVIEMLITEGLPKEAANDCRALIERTTDPYRKVMRRLRLGDIHLSAGDRDAAVEVYRNTLNDVGVDSWLESRVLAQIEQCYSRDGNLASLKKEYERLLDEFPRRVGVRRGYASLLAKAGDSEQAIEQFQQILKITPGDRENQEAYIRLLAACEKTKEATEQLRTLIKQHPADAELYVQLAELYAASKDEKATREAVEEFLNSSDQREYSHVRAARLLERFDLTDAARRQYAALTEAFPDSPSAKEARAAFLYKTGDKALAIQMWKASAENQDAGQAVRAARALAARQEHQAAYELLAARQESFRNDPVFLAQIVEVATTLKKHEEAIPLALRGVELALTPATLEDAIAQAARAIERAEQAPEQIAKLQASPQLTAQRACLLAELLERQGETQRAEAVLSTLAEQGDLLAASQFVTLARGRHDWKTAIQGAERLFELPGGRKSRTAQMLVELNERALDLPQAIKWIPAWKKLSPGGAMPWLAESRLLINQGATDQAIEVLRRALREFDNAPELRSRLAQLYESLGKFSDAERLYWRELDDSQDAVERLRVIEQLARLAHQQGEGDKLVEKFQERRREDPTSVEPLMALATIYRVLDNHKQRMAVLAEASSLRPHDAELLQQIARIEEREGDWRQAVETLKRATEVDPSGKARLQLARLHLSMGDLDEGYRLLTENPHELTDARKVESLAEAMIANQEWERAAEFLSRFRDRWPDDYRLRFLSGVVLEETNELQQAADLFLAVLRHNEESPPPASSASPANPQQSYFEQLARIAPPGVCSLLESSASYHFAYLYQKQNRSASAGGFA